MESPIIFTEAAKEEIKDLLGSGRVPEDMVLRVTANGACSGVNYSIGIDFYDESADEKLSTDGFEFVFSKKELMYLIGIQVDFVCTEFEQGFLLKKL